MISVQRDFDQNASGSALVESLHREAVYKTSIYLSGGTSHIGSVFII